MGLVINTSIKHYSVLLYLSILLINYQPQWEMREPDDPGKYLLAIWTPGEKKIDNMLFLN